MYVNTNCTEDTYVCRYMQTLQGTNYCTKIKKHRVHVFLYSHTFSDVLLKFGEIIIDFLG